MDKEFEKQCLAKLSLDDHEAFKSLFLFYFPKIKYFITKQIKSEIEAEDLAQDIFEKIWLVRKDLSAIDSFSSYLYRMSINTVFNSLKKKNNHKIYLEYLLHNKINQEKAEEAIYAREIELLILLAVSNMPVQRRKIFEMSRYQGLKNMEIARLINISKRTVEVHVSLALKEIRKIIPSFLSFFF